jgi:hypothetical protein
MSKISAFLEKMNADFHIPVALLIFGTTTIYHFKTHLDLGSQYVNSIYALYAFLGGHAWINRPGAGDPPPTT